MIVARSLEGRAAASVKPDTLPVTGADLAIQALIARRLCQGLSERGAATKGCSRRTVYFMLPYSKRFNARPEIAASDAE